MKLELNEESMLALGIVAFCTMFVFILAKMPAQERKDSNEILTAGSPWSIVRDRYNGRFGYVDEAGRVSLGYTNQALARAAMLSAFVNALPLAETPAEPTNYLRLSGAWTTNDLNVRWIGNPLTTQRLVNLTNIEALLNADIELGLSDNGLVVWRSVTNKP